jgi:multidrug efflux pump subunit AcrA (membrane-fusion protein)
MAVAAAVVVLAGGGAAIEVLKPFSSPPAASSASADPTGLKPVFRQSLSQQTTANGTLGYAGDYSVVVPTAGGQGQSSGQGKPGGTFTALPVVGQVLRQGQSVYSVSGSPVALLYGSVPAYRGLSQGMTGTDVRQLNADLVALGEATRSELNPGSDYFGPATATALEKLQDGLGLPRTGTLPIGEVVFQPDALMVSGVSATLGEPAQAGGAVLQGTSTTRQVVAQVDATQQSDVAPGAQVSIVLPDNQTTPGVVTSISTAASAPSGSGSGSSDSSESSGSSSSSSSSSNGASPDTINVNIKLTDQAAAGSLQQAPVQVNITTTAVHDVLAVPIDALMTEPGGYDVEVAGPHGTRRLVPVSLGLFDDAAGMVQVTGKGLSAGDQVVVPQI